MKFDQNHWSYFQENFAFCGIVEWALFFGGKIFTGRVMGELLNSY
jgi:hypothetical protein